jgi:predicted transcriptional regulator
MQPFEIEAERLRLKVTRQDLCRCANVHVMTYRRILRGADHNTATIGRLCEAVRQLKDGTIKLSAPAVRRC